jgi:formate hydrogenlyase subunit 3/multisubunit Na+/H+ antiporter MnhD subunit
MTANLHVWLIPVLPLAGAAINGLLGKRFSRQAVSSIALAACGAAFTWGLYVAFTLLRHWTPEVRWAEGMMLPHEEFLAHWIRSGNFQVDFSFYLDQLSLVMLLVVTGVGFLIHIYSVGYMWDDDGYYRFMSYLNLFMFFMLTLVLAKNYLVMFIGWEGVGLASYLLIGFWFTKDSAAAAGKKAFIVNRIGDFGFLIALFLMIQHFGSLDFTHVFAAVRSLPTETAGAGLLTAIGLLLMVGAAGKSAQIPCGYHRHCADRHQESSGLLDGLAARVHVHGLRRGGILSGHLSLDDACVLQGATVPGSRFGNPRRWRRTGHAQDGRAAGLHAVDVCDDGDCDARYRGHSATGWLLVQRRDPLAGL